MREEAYKERRGSMVYVYVQNEEKKKKKRTKARESRAGFKKAIQSNQRSKKGLVRMRDEFTHTNRQRS